MQISPNLTLSFLQYPKYWFRRLKVAAPDPWLEVLSWQMPVCICGCKWGHRAELPIRPRKGPDNYKWSTAWQGERDWCFGRDDDGAPVNPDKTDRDIVKVLGLGHTLLMCAGVWTEGQEEAAFSVAYCHELLKVFFSPRKISFQK